MKKLLAASLVSAVIVCQAQTVSEPGWFDANRETAATLPPSAPQAGKTAPEISPQKQNPTPVAETISPRIEALARGLENDPVRILNYVHDHIDYVLYFGSKKGADLTLLEKSGNDFDQSALLVALLRAAGYTNAAYQFGWMHFPYEATDGTHNDLRHWLGLSQVNTNFDVTLAYLEELFWNKRGYPTWYSDYLYFPTATNSFAFQRVWVTLTISNTNYYLDPAFKVTEPLAATNLATATGLNTNTLMTGAGGTATGDYVSNLNEGVLRNTLLGYTTNLLNYLQSNCPTASVEEVLGTRYIVPSTDTTLRTNLMFETLTWNAPGYVMPVVDWENQPTDLMSTVAVSFAGTNVLLRMPELKGHRLALTFDGNGLAQLWEDDTVLAQRATSGPSRTNVVIAVHHPVGEWNYANNVVTNATAFDQTVTNSYQRTNATYALTYAFEPDWGWLQARQNQLDAYRHVGLSETSREVVSETLNILGLNWLIQSDRVGRILAGQMDCLPPQAHNRLGRAGQESGRGYYLDVYVQLSGLMAAGGTNAATIDRKNRYFDLMGYFESALEHGDIEQLQPGSLAAASTVKMLRVASTNGQAIYLGRSANWTTGANVRSQLINYPNLPALDDLISSGYYLLLPRNGANTVAGPGSWAGYGYIGHLKNSINHIARFTISGGYQGGFVSDPSATVNPYYIALFGNAQPQYFIASSPFVPNVTGADPVTMSDASFTIDSTDLSLGAPEPRGLSFARHYSSARRYTNPAGMAGGWLHNYYVNAAEVSAPQAGLGATTPAQMAPILAATCASIGIYNEAQPNPKNWLVTALIAKWAVDQLTKKGVSVMLGKNTLQFVRQPNAVYTPPANCTMTLSMANGVYSLQERHGNLFNFDTSGRLTNLMDQYSQSLSVSYLSSTSSLPQIVTDWKGRTLTFGYSGTPQRLTSVTDNSGRSVVLGYANTYSSQGDLVSVTDPESKTSSFGYDPDHQITATVDALSRFVTSNVYNGFGRVVTQYSEGDTNKAWQIYWSGDAAVEQDPGGGKRRYYYDQKSRLVGAQDALGNLSRTWYDGQDHIVMTVSPLAETNRFVFDGRHNCIQALDPLGFTNLFYFDALDLLKWSCDPRGNSNRFGYNADFQMTGSTNGAGDWQTFFYSPTDGLLSTRTDAAGVTTYGYDGYRQLASITHPGGLGSEGFLNSSLGDVLSRTNARRFVTSFQYNHRRELTNTIAPTNLTTRVMVDAVGNTQATIDPRGFGATNAWSATRKLLSTRLSATPQGVPVATNIYDRRDWLSRTVNPLQQTTLLTNDGAGRRISVTDPLLRTTRFSFDADGRQIASTNQALEVAQQAWSKRGELVRHTDAATNIVSRVYDWAGNQAILTNRNGKRWRFYYDGANRLTNTITPLNRQTWQLWNNRGLLSAVREPSGQWLTNFHDARGRVTNRVDGAGSILYQFDPNNNLTNIVEGGRSNSWTFDAYDRVSTYRDADGNLFQYGRDANGNLTTLVYPGGKTVSYGWDSLNRLTNVTDWANRKTSIEYDLASRVKKITRPNGTVREMNYDAAGQMTNIVERTASGAAIAFFKLGWNDAARVEWEFAAPLPHAYTPPPRLMTYDDDNRVATFNGQSVVHDLDGNMTTGPLTNSTLVSYAYDARNRLISAGGISCGYDPAGNRVAITNGANVTRFVVDPNAALSQVLIRVQPGATNYYVYGLGLLYEADDADTKTYHYDYRGSTIAITDSGGNVTDRIEYSAYGVTTYRAGNTDTPFLFNGRYGVMTEPNGLLYMRARYYNPYVCRFINPDPAGFSGGLNLYAFADGDPTSKNDPMGLQSWMSPGYGSIPNPTFGQVESNPLSFGVTSVIGAEGGYSTGAGGQFSVGGGIFIPANPNDTSIGGFSSGGASAGSPGEGLFGSRGSVDAVQSPTGAGPAFLGSSLGAGSGLWISNAGSASQLGGPFDQWNLNFYFFTVSFAQSGDTWIASATMGPGAGAGASKYPTTTFSAGGISLSGHPDYYRPNK